MESIFKVTRIAGKWGFAFTLLVFVSIATTAAVMGLKFKEYSNWVAHTGQVLDRIDQVEILIERAETNQRGYLMRKTPESLQTYRGAAEDLSPVLDELKSLVSDNPGQKARALELEVQVRSRLEKMASVVEFSRTHSFAETVTLVDLIGNGLVRASANAMSLEEQNLLETRKLRAQSSAQIAIILIVIAALMSLALMFLAFRVLSASAQKNFHQSSLLQLIFDNMGDGLMVVDMRGRVTHFNRAAERQIGTLNVNRTSEERIGSESFIDVRTGQPLKQEDSAVGKALRGIATNDLEIMHRGSDAAKILSIDARPIQGADGVTIGALALFRDVTERKQVELNWQKSREAAVEASKLKSDFLATMSHEIRTPMNGVVGMTNLLLDTTLSADQDSFVKTIKSSADALLTLIDQILDHSKIESGKLELANSNFNLHECVEGVLAMFRYMARSKNVDLELVLDPTLPEFVKGDPARLRQVLINLVGNALKFTTKGYVRLTAESALCSTSVHKVMFEIRDTGIGIPKAVQSRLFEKFSQVHKATFTNLGGSGLGLMISRELVKLMGGSIGVESAEGFGSRFWFTSEFQIGEKVTHAPLNENFERKKFSGHILVAEDQMINQLVIQKYLEMFGLTSDIAGNGEEAVSKIKAKKFDLVLMDCQMPKMNGYDATTAIRAYELTVNQRTPIIALTAEGRSGDRRRCFDVGMDDFLTKPVDLNRLQDLLTERFSERVLNEPFDGERLFKLHEYESGGRALSDVLIEDFLKTAPEILAKMQASLKAGDRDTVQSLAHALKSSSLTLGLEAVGKLCGDLEELPTSQELVRELDRALTQGASWLINNLKSRRDKVA